MQGAALVTVRTGFIRAGVRRATLFSMGCLPTWESFHALTAGRMDADIWLTHRAQRLKDADDAKVTRKGQSTSHRTCLNRPVCDQLDASQYPPAPGTTSTRTILTSCQPDSEILPKDTYARGMGMRLMIRLGLVCLGLTLGAQTPSELDIQSLKQTLGAPQNQQQHATDPTPFKGALTPKSPEIRDPEANRVGMSKEELDARENAKIEAEIKELKAKEKGPRRFASDLFAMRQANPSATTEGGISEDYVLGTGDNLALNVFGTATFELPALVDGRGEVVIPKVGSVKVAGLTLSKAKQVVQGLVGRHYFGSTVDIQVMKLREVRVFILGEVYRGGSFLVPSLSSLVNVLSLAGGPTQAGSFRDIRVVRGGQIIHRLDLYPLRAEGLGNVNFSLQSGDLVFVPLAKTRVLLEGAFARVAVEDATPAGASEDKLKKATGEAKVSSETNPDKALPRMVFEMLPQESAAEAVGFAGGVVRAAYAETFSLRTQDAQGRTSIQDLPSARLAQAKLQDGDILSAFLKRDRLTNVVSLNGWVRVPGTFARTAGLRVADLLKRDDQILPDTYLERGEVVRTAEDGKTRFLQFQVRKALAGDPQENLPLEDRDRVEIFKKQSVEPAPMVTFVNPFGAGGTAPLHAGMTVADLIHRSGIPRLEGGKLVLPELFLRRGELVRKKLDGTTELLTFDAEKAFLGDPQHNLALADKDAVELFKLDRMRLPRKVTLNGPFTQAGTFDLHDNMRVSDLVFKAGIPQKSANRFLADLARAQGGKPSTVTRLDLAPLTSSEGGSPLALKDDALNPLLQEDDVLSVFEKPDFRLHRTVRVRGQVARPGTYVLDQDKPTLSQVIAKAGGLTPEAMPRAGILLRSFDAGTDLGAKGINEILGRLNETKMFVEKAPGTAESLKATLFRPPVLHGVAETKVARLVVDFEGALKGERNLDTEVLDGDDIIIPRQIDSASVVGETSSPFGSYKVTSGMKVSDLLGLAGGTTRNADTWNVRLVKANGRIVDSWVSARTVEPGDTLIVPQRIRRESNWQEDLTALTSVGLILNALATAGHL